MTPFETRLRTTIGSISLVVGLSVFLIRFQHAGPYAWLEGGNRIAGVLALGLGAALVRPWFGSGGAVLWSTRAALVVTPLVLFFALYATLAELEEVVVVSATHRASGETVPLRLWVVDHAGVPWVSMPRGKANEHALDGAQVELVRDGVAQCVIAERFEDRAAVERTFRLRTEKYRVQRLAMAIGLFGQAPGEEGVTLRLAPCPAG